MASSDGRAVVRLGSTHRLPRDSSAAQVSTVARMLRDELQDSRFQQPLLSGTVVSALELLDDEPDLRDVARLIRSDPGLAVQVMRLAGSARYAGAAAPPDLESAVSRVGTDGLRDLLLFASAGRLLKVPGDREFSERLGRRSRGVAIAARALALAAGKPAPEAFLAGLLHDMGLAAAHSLLPRLAAFLPDLPRAPAQRAELAAVVHEELGAALAAHWGLPPTVIAAMGFHHRPALAPPGSWVAWVVAAAVDVVAAIDDPEAPAPRLDALGIPPANQDWVVRDLHERLRDAA